jgi:subtilisin family serine protease
MKRQIVIALLVIALLASAVPASAALTSTGQIGVNVLLNTKITNNILNDLKTHGTVLKTVEEINALTMNAAAEELSVIRSLPYVAAANPDAERKGAPVDTVAATDFMTGLSTWDLDAINVTDPVLGRTIPYNGNGVYVAVLDTGLLDSWRQYFPEERIAEEYAIAFGGGGGEVGDVSSQPNKWEHDQNSHGTHVTSTILGYSMGAAAVNGVAPLATVIPVKVLNQNGSGWSSVVAAGITYVADLKAGPLKGCPVVINMSLGGPGLDAMEKAAIDYAIGKGVIIVASAGNEGEAGMGYPGAYEPVISVAAAGWTGEWRVPGSWWRLSNVADPTNIQDFYITDFSSREHEGQDLDVAAPGSWVVGPYQNNSGSVRSYYYLGGTSMASPHVAGVVALMAQKNPALTAGQAESILEGTAMPIDHWSAEIVDSNTGSLVSITWGSDAVGSGLVQADRALGLNTAGSVKGKK